MSKQLEADGDDLDEHFAFEWVNFVTTVHLLWAIFKNYKSNQKLNNNIEHWELTNPLLPWRPHPKQKCN